MRWLLPVVLLAIMGACATSPANEGTPSRRAVSAALLQQIYLSCDPGPEIACNPPPRRIVLSRLSCVRGGGDRAGQVLCTYSGHRDMGAIDLAFDGECAWLEWVSDTRTWWIRDFPDADMCGGT